MQEKPDLHYYEIDLRELIRTLLKGWKVILALTLVFGAAAFGYSKMQTPVYEVGAQISIDADTLGLSINPVNFLLSDHIRQQVAGALSISIDELPGTLTKDNDEPPFISVQKHSIGDTTYIIKIQHEDAIFAREMVNTWVDTGLLSVLDFLTPYLEEESVSREKLNEADRALINYLEENQLERWTWTDLALLTGFGQQPTVLLAENLQADSTTGNMESISDSDSVTVLPDLQGLPSISSQQRLDIVQLMRAKSDAESAYNSAYYNARKAEYALETTPPVILNHAVLPEEPVNLHTLRNTAMGIILGGLLGVACVLIESWWQQDNAENERVKQQLKK